MTDWDKFDGPNPCRKIKKIQEPLSKLRHLSPDEESRLLAASPEPLRTIILVGIYSGLRIEAEALTLRWENVHFKRRELTVEAAYSKNNETQAILMNSKLLEALKRHDAKRTGDYVFLNRYGKPIPIGQSVRTTFTTACRHANLPGVTPHTLRRTFASRLGMTGANDRTLQALGRWKEPKMIQRSAHVSQTHLAEAGEKISENSTTLFTQSKSALS